jgi:hypothetical protein
MIYKRTPAFATCFAGKKRETYHGAGRQGGARRKTIFYLLNDCHDLRVSQGL